MTLRRKDPPEARFSINVVEDASSRLLLLHRGHRTTLAPGKWGFSAGHIEAGETPEACSRRELREELGAAVIVEPAGRLGPIRDVFYGGRFEIHLFHYAYVEGDIRLNDEHTEYAWVSREEFLDYDVMNGTDEDILFLGIWPREYLNAARLPPRDPD